MKKMLITRCSVIVWALICHIITVVLPGNAFGQLNSSIEKALARDFSMASDKDGKWVFVPENANIKKIDNPLLMARIPGYNFYQVSLTNYLGYHVNRGTCVVLFDSIKSKTRLVEPM